MFMEMLDQVVAELWLQTSKQASYVYTISQFLTWQKIVDKIFEAKQKPWNSWLKIGALKIFWLYSMQLSCILTAHAVVIMQLF